MNRRHFISSLGASGLAAAIASPALAADGATILWPVAGDSAGWLEYGEIGSAAPGKLARNDGMGFVPHGSRVLRVRLTDLKPGRNYWFKTHTRPVVLKDYATAEIKVTTSKTYSLRLPDPTAAEAKFCVWNDTHDQPKNLRAPNRPTSSFGTETSATP